MDRPDRFRLEKYTALVALVIAIPIAIAVSTRSAATKEPAKLTTTPLGDTLPTVTLKTLDGKPLSLRERLGGRPAVIYVTTVAECASCSNLPLEMEIVRKASPRLEALVIGSGSTIAEFRPYFTQMGMTSSAVVDEDRALLRALHVSAETIVLLVDPTGRIVFADQRASPKRAHYPTSRLLHDMIAVLDLRRPTPAP
jgi:peroxiredoxin